MNHIERMRLIGSIEEETESKMLIYITGDRKGQETKISTDVFPFITNILSKFSQNSDFDHISLFLYSSGGITMAGFGLVNLIREFCNKLTVIIPFKALSCASLVALGADEIIMTQMSQLSAIDPSIVSILGPRIDTPGIPLPPHPPIPVSVEDIVAYVDMAKSIGIENQEHLSSIFKVLSEKIHPIVLGQTYRIREQIKFLAKSLLESAGYESNKIKNIIENLTVGRYSHDYLISRKEAQEILELKIKDVSPDLDNVIIKLFQEYREILLLANPYSPELVLSDSDENTITLDRAIIESSDMTYVFRTEMNVKRVQMGPPQVPIPTLLPVETKLREEWVLDNEL